MTDSEIKSIFSSKLRPLLDDHVTNITNEHLQELVDLIRVHGSKAVRELVEVLGKLLVSNSAALRVAGMSVLSRVIGLTIADELVKVPKSILFDSDLVETLGEFFLDRMEDDSTIYESMEGLRHVIRSGNVRKGMKIKILDSLLWQLKMHVQSMPQLSRRSYYLILKDLMEDEEGRQQMKEKGEETCWAFIQAMDGEKEPRNLLYSLLLFSRIVQLVNSAADRYGDDLFEITSCYFPITFTQKHGDPNAITKTSLVKALRDCMISSVGLWIPFLIEKLASSIIETKLEVFESIIHCIAINTVISRPPSNDHSKIEECKSYTDHHASKIDMNSSNLSDLNISSSFKNSPPSFPLSSSRLNEFPKTTFIWANAVLPSKEIEKSFAPLSFSNSQFQSLWTPNQVAPFAEQLVNAIINEVFQSTDPDVVQEALKTLQHLLAFFSLTGSSSSQSISNKLVQKCIAVIERHFGINGSTSNGASGNANSKQNSSTASSTATMETKMTTLSVKLMASVIQSSEQNMKLLMDSVLPGLESKFVSNILPSERSALVRHFYNIAATSQYYSTPFNYDEFSDRKDQQSSQDFSAMPPPMPVHPFAAYASTLSKYFISIIQSTTAYPQEVCDAISALQILLASFPPLLNQQTSQSILQILLPFLTSKFETTADKAMTVVQNSSNQLSHLQNTSAPNTDASSTLFQSYGNPVFSAALTAISHLCSNKSPVSVNLLERYILQPLTSLLLQHINSRTSSTSKALSQQQKTMDQSSQQPQQIPNELNEKCAALIGILHFLSSPIKDIFENEEDQRGRHYISHGNHQDHHHGHKEHKHHAHQGNAPSTYHAFSEHAHFSSNTHLCKYQIRISIQDFLIKILETLLLKIKTDFLAQQDNIESNNDYNYYSIIVDGDIGLINTIMSSLSRTVETKLQTEKIWQILFDLVFIPIRSKLIHLVNSKTPLTRHGDQMNIDEKEEQILASKSHATDAYTSTAFSTSSPHFNSFSCINSSIRCLMELFSYWMPKMLANVLNALPLDSSRDLHQSVINSMFSNDERFMNINMELFEHKEKEEGQDLQQKLLFKLIAVLPSLCICVINSPTILLESVPLTSKTDMVIDGAHGSSENGVHCSLLFELLLALMNHESASIITNTMDVNQDQHRPQSLALVASAFFATSPNNATISQLSLGTPGARFSQILTSIMSIDSISPFSTNSLEVAGKEAMKTSWNLSSVNPSSATSNFLKYDSITSIPKLSLRILNGIALASILNKVKWTQQLQQKLSIFFLQNENSFIPILIHVLKFNVKENMLESPPWNHVEENLIEVLFWLLKSIFMLKETQPLASTLMNHLKSMIEIESTASEEKQQIFAAFFQILFFEHSATFPHHSLLYKQKIWSLIMPSLMNPMNSTNQATMEGQGSMQMSALSYAILSHLIAGLPKPVLIQSIQIILPIIISSLKHFESQRQCGESVKALKTILSSSSNDFSLLDTHLHSIIPSLVKIVASASTHHGSFPSREVSMHKPVAARASTRLDSLHLLLEMLSLPFHKIYPFKNEVIEGLAKALDDPKRMVRAKVVQTRNQWLLLMGTQKH